MEMAVKSMETVVEAMESMEMAPGALCQWRRQSCGTLLGKTPIDLGFRLQKA
jgi:hypothetical protein